MRRFRLEAITFAFLSILVLASVRSNAADSTTGVITTLAGTGAYGFAGDGAAATAAQMRTPGAVAVDSSGNVYIADTINNRIRKVSSATGNITTIAGNGSYSYGGDGGPATAAQLANPSGVAVDTAGNVYIADTYNHRIRRVAVGTGIITTVAGSGSSGYGGDGGPPTAAQLNYPRGIAVDGSGNLYIADTQNNRVRKVSGGIITTLAGSGVYGFSGDGAAAIAAQMRSPAGVAVDAAGNVYVADTSNQRIRKVTAANGNINTVAGTGNSGFSGEAGAATSADLNDPVGVAVDSAGNFYIADYYNQRIRKVTVSTGLITTIAGGGTYGFGGDGGAATAAQLNYPRGAAVDAAGNVYIADSDNNRIRKVTAPTTPALIIATMAGSGGYGFSGDGAAATAAQMRQPRDVAVDAAGNVYFSDPENYRIRRVTASSGIITTFAGNGYGFGGDGGPATAAQLGNPTGIAIDAAGNLYIADYYNHRIRKVTAATGVITTVAGSGSYGFGGDGGPATAAQLYYPSDVAVDGAGNLYIADTDNNRIRKVTAGTNVISTFAGSGTYGFSGDGAAATAAQLRLPSGVAVDASGNVYIADTNNVRIRKVTAATGNISTVAGTGNSGFTGEAGAATSARLDSPVDVAVDTAGNFYIADYYNHRIRKVTLATGLITTIAGSGTNGFGGDGGVATAALINYPSGVAVDSGGSVFIADRNNYRVRAALAPVAAPASLSATAISNSQVALSWSAVADATSYEVWRSSYNGAYGLVATPAGTSTTDSGLATDTCYLYKVRAVRGAVTSTFTPIDLATTTAFTNASLSGMQIRALHVTQLRTAVNAVRAAAGLPVATFTDPSVNAGTAIKRLHIVELRTALDAARASLGVAAVAYNDNVVVTASTTIRAVHITDLRTGTQ